MATARKKKPKAQSDCVIPTRPPTEVLREYVLEHSPHEERDVTEYVAWQLSKGVDTEISIDHLEPVKSEVVFGREHKVWDVHTSVGRWWVVTEPTNLYSHEHFPSPDYLLSFHVGLMARVASRDTRKAKSGNAERFANAWRRWEQAAAAADKAKEAEDFQSVGMKCRECLLAFVRGSQEDIEIPVGSEPPKRGDFIQWAHLLAEYAASGAHGKDLRAYLKQLASAAWPLVNWLTHTSNAVQHDAEVAIASTRHILEAFAGALIRRESERPDRCPKCSSYQVQSFFVPDIESDPPYLLVCMACGWEAETADAKN